MTTAVPTRIRGKRFVLRDVSWDLYERLVNELAPQHLFLTYYKGTLELMSPSFPHDRYSRLIFMLIHAMAEEFDVPLISAGTTTLRLKNLKVGLEADEAFYTTHLEKVRTANEIDLAIHPPPDLAVEVEASRRLGKRKSIYAKLGIPEVWSYNGEQLTVQILRARGRYSLVDRSPTFPKISLQEIARFVQSGTPSDDVIWIKSFRAYLKSLRS